MKINLFDDSAWETLRPLTFTRPVANLRIGILTIAEKWEKRLNATSGFITQAYLSSKFKSLENSVIYINGSICPDMDLVKAVSNLNTDEVLLKNDVIIAYNTSSNLNYLDAKALKVVEYASDFTRIQFPENIFIFNGQEIEKDFDLLTQGRVSAKLSDTNRVLGDRIFVEEGVEAECAIFNTLKGAIYLGKDSKVFENSAIRGPFALGEKSIVKMGAKIYGNTTIGFQSTIGGEVNNAVIWGHSAKGHEGYLGNAVLGEWCNIGADTNNSNLKNNYAEVRIWDYTKQSFRKTGLQFCGLVMADHAKCAINTMFNTGTVVGVSANIFGSGFPRNFVPDFSWGGAQGFEVYGLNKMFETAEKVFARKNLELSQIEKDIITQVFELTQDNRRF